MPHRETTPGRGVPLYLVPHLVMRALHAHGGETDRTGAKRFSRHVFTVGARTTPVRREFRRLWRAGPVAAAGPADCDAGTESPPAVYGSAGKDGNEPWLIDWNASRKNSPVNPGDAGENPGQGDPGVSPEKNPAVAGGPGACGAIPGPASPGPGQQIVPVTAGNGMTGEDPAGPAGRTAWQEYSPGFDGYDGDPGGTYRLFDWNAGRKRSQAPQGDGREKMP